MTFTITIVIIALTAIISYTAFSNQKVMNDLIFHPPAVTNQNQWYRFFSCGLIHADITHLAFNMLSLFMFGRFVEESFADIFGKQASIVYLVLYISALAISLLPTYFKHKTDDNYYSLGASGAVSAIVFAGIFLFPTAKIGIFIIPPFIPGFIFAPIYLFISAYLSKKGGDNINHSAHIWGSVYGVVFLIAVSYLFSDFDPIYNFIESIKIWAR
jgi:membrane associated rhomboid family serine protease